MTVSIQLQRQAVTISIPTLRVEGDKLNFVNGSPPALFQSTPSEWRVTEVSICRDIIQMISIHTLRVEGDSKSIQSEKALAFYH